MERLFISITSSFRSPWGGCFVFKRRWAYIPTSRSRNYHRNRKLDPEFPIYIEKKSAPEAVTENKTATETDMNDRKMRRLLSRSQLYRNARYYRLAGGRKILRMGTASYDFCMRDVISKDDNVCSCHGRLMTANQTQSGPSLAAMQR